VNDKIDTTWPADDDDDDTDDDSDEHKCKDDESHSDYHRRIYTSRIYRPTLINSDRKPKTKPVCLFYLGLVKIKIILIVIFLN